MLRKSLVLSLIVLVLNAFGGNALLAQTQKDVQTAEAVQKVKDKISKIGTGEKSKVRVEMIDKRVVKGFVSAVDNDSFTLTDKKSGATTKIDYTQVKRLNRSGVSAGVKIAAIAVLAVPAIILISLISIRCNNEGGC